MDDIKKFDELLKHLEETIGKVLEDIDVSDRPIDIGISLNIYPMIIVNADAPSPARQNRFPVDILETDKQIHAVVALPEIDSDTIKLNCNGHILEISAMDDKRPMQEKIELPAMVIKTGMKATYVNGILEVIFNKSKKKCNNKNSNI